MKRSCKGASGCKAASGASHAKRQRSQRRKLQPPAATSAAARAAHASSQRHNLKRKIEPGLYGRMANPKWKTRVPGLFGMRHWVDPQHKEAFIRELEAINKKEEFSRSEVLFHGTYENRAQTFTTVQTRSGAHNVTVCAEDARYADSHLHITQAARVD